MPPLWLMLKLPLYRKGELRLLSSGSYKNCIQIEDPLTKGLFSRSCIYFYRIFLLSSICIDFFEAY